MDCLKAFGQLQYKDNMMGPREFVKTLLMEMLCFIITQVVYQNSNSLVAYAVSNQLSAAACLMLGWNEINIYGAGD